jgi:hypothetical protein
VIVPIVQEGPGEFVGGFLGREGFKSTLSRLAPEEIHIFKSLSDSSIHALVKKHFSSVDVL